MGRFPAGRALAAALALGALAQAPARAQQTAPAPAPAASPSQTVVVTGHRPSKPKTVEQAARAFVERTTSPSPKIGQPTRWRDPVCPLVENLDPAFNAFITARIKAVAKEVGAPVHEPCQLNIEVLFVDDPQQTIDGVAKDHPELLGFFYPPQEKAIATVTRPIQAWYRTATTNDVETYIDDPWLGTPTGRANSVFSHGLRSVFDHVLIVVSFKDAFDQPVGPIADYIAMLALARIKPQDGCAALPSILDLMAPDCADKPQGLTTADMAFLHGLYDADPRDNAGVQDGDIAHQIVSKLKPAPKR